MRVVLITGGTAGIGRALALQLVNRELKVYVIGRKRAALAELASIGRGNIIPIEGDLSDPGNFPAIIANLRETLGGDQLSLVVHNAATEAPVKKLLDVDEDDFDYAISLNLKAPLFLTKYIRRELDFTGRILLVSSGLSQNVIPHMSTYSITKMALEVLYQGLKTELQDSGIVIGCVRPGIVDTGMQDRLRRLSSDMFPSVIQFRRFQTESQLSKPSDVARFMTWLLLDTGDDVFSSKIWDFYQAEDRRPYEEFMNRAEFEGGM